MKDTGLTERSFVDAGKPVRRCDSAHMSASAYSHPGAGGLHHRGFTTPSGAWHEVWWLASNNGHVMYVYEDTRGLNRR